MNRGFGIDLLQQVIPSSAVHQPADLTVRIVHVTEYDGICRTGLRTCRLQFLINKSPVLRFRLQLGSLYPLDAEVNIFQ